MSFRKEVTTLLLITLVLLAIFFILLRLPQGKDLKIIFLDVGQGDATLIITPGGRKVLVDGGPSEEVQIKINEYLPFYDRTIDVVVATHPDTDHVAGLLPVISNYRSSLFLHSGLMAGGGAYKVLLEKINEQDIGVITARAGQVVSLDNDTYLQVLWPYNSFYSDDSNEYSVVLRLVHHDTSVLLTGDIGTDTEHRLISTYTSVGSDILKLGHHGSRTSSSEEFLVSVQPEFGIVSASCNNPFGHPHRDVVTRVSNLGIQILDTCLSGDIVFISDGTDIWQKKTTN
jgi:competence protein ComEC